MNGRTARRGRNEGAPLTGDALACVLTRAGLTDGPWGRVVAHAGEGERGLRLFAGPAETARLHEGLVRTSARGRADVAAHFATIVATHLAAAVPLGTLLAGEPLHLPDPAACSVEPAVDGWASTLVVPEATPHWSTAEATVAGRHLVDVLAPVVDVLARLGGRSRRSLWNVVATRVGYIGGEHAGRAGVLPGRVVEGLLDEVIAATAPHVTRRPELRTYRHARGSYRTVVFRGCCLGYRLDGEGCPFCPRYPAARQQHEVAAWLDTLTADELLKGIPAAA